MLRGCSLFLLLCCGSMKWMIIAAASLVVGTCVRPDPNPMDLEFQEWKIKFSKEHIKLTFNLQSF